MLYANCFNNLQQVKKYQTVFVWFLLSYKWVGLIQFASISKVYNFHQIWMHNCSRTWKVGGCQQKRALATTGCICICFAHALPLVYKQCSFQFLYFWGHYCIFSETNAYLTLLTVINGIIQLQEESHSQRKKGTFSCFLNSGDAPCPSAPRSTAYVWLCTK